MFCKPSDWMKVCLFAVLTFTPRTGAIGETVFESAAGTHQSSGTLANDDSWFFHNFEVTSTVQLAEIGAYVETFNPGQLFGAVVALTSKFDFPNSFDLSTADLLGTTLIDVPDTGINGAEVSGGLNLTLQPGWYALGFGTGAFGAATAPQFDIAFPSHTVDLVPDEYPYSQFQSTHPHAPNSRVYQVSAPRFFAKSFEPSADFDHSGAVNSGDLQTWQANYGLTVQADADGDGDSDGADFLLWQQQLTPTSESIVSNGDFETGDLTDWTPVITPNGSVTSGFPRVELFDVTGDGEATDAMRIRVGQVSFDSGNPAGGGLAQNFTIGEAGTFSAYADIASTNTDITGNTGPGRFELRIDGMLVDVVDMNGTSISPGETRRDFLSGTVVDLAPGEHSLELLVLRSATNTRHIYQYFDNVSLTRLGTAVESLAIPEPSSALLVAWMVSAALLRPSHL